MGIGNATEVPIGVKGVERLECRNFGRFHYRKLRYAGPKEQAGALGVRPLEMP